MAWFPYFFRTSSIVISNFSDFFLGGLVPAEKAQLFLVHIAGQIDGGDGYHPDGRAGFPGGAQQVHGGRGDFLGQPGGSVELGLPGDDLEKGSFMSIFTP